MSEQTLKIDFTTYAQCKLACLHFHYAKAVPASKLIKFGVWENNVFKGCVVFGGGANKFISSPYGLQTGEVCELVRVALRQHDNPVTKIVSICLKLLKKHYPKLKLVISYADENQGHVGGIYKAGNWIYTGEFANERGIMFLGKLKHRRTINQRYGSSKIEYLKTIDPNVSVLKGKSKHKYIYPLDSSIKKDLLSLSRTFPMRL